MTKLQFIAFTLLGLATFPLNAADTNTFKDDKEKNSYALGLSLANNWKRNDVDLDSEAVIRGLKDVYSGIPQKLSDEEIQMCMRKIQNGINVRQAEKRKAELEKNKKESEVFLAENKTKPGIVTLPSGLQYKVITAGTGAIPNSSDTVVVNYRGTLIDGTEFDSSAKHGTSATFPVTGVIQGWQEALQLMKVGSKWQLFVPSNLAYKEYGSRPIIGPNAALIFEVELLSISPPAAPKPAITPQPVVSDIIKVPSAEEMKKGAKIETIKAGEVQKEIEKNQPKQ